MELVGVGVVEFGEDGQGVLPGVLSGVAIAGGVVRVAEVDEGGGLPLAVAEGAEEVEGALVAGDGLVVVAELVVGVAEAVPGGGFPPPVAEFVEGGGACRQVVRASA